MDGANTPWCYESRQVESIFRSTTHPDYWREMRGLRNTHLQEIREDTLPTPAIVTTELRIAVKIVPWTPRIKHEVCTNFQPWGQHERGNFTVCTASSEHVCLRLCQNNVPSFPYALTSKVRNSSTIQAGLRGCRVVCRQN
jgi:hypothetical protein